jgi:hypothetical protein
VADVVVDLKRRCNMKYPLVSIMAVAAMTCAPAAADAGIRKHHHQRDLAAFPRSVRGAYLMYAPRGIQQPPANSWTGDPAVGGDNANSMSGPNSAPENEGSNG